MPMDPLRESSDKSSGFLTTHWSVVLAAGERCSAESATALEQLCQAYWKPLFEYARRRESDIHAAEDLTQAFFARLLEKNDLARATPVRGRFRAFLLTAFKHFLSNEWDRARTQKRGGEQIIVPLEAAEIDGHSVIESNSQTPEVLYERQWAMTLLNRVMSRLEAEQQQLGKGLQFNLLKESLIRSADSMKSSAIARELGMTESATRMAASRLRRRYQELLRDEIAQTVSTEAEVDNEIRQLFRSFSE